MINVSGIRKEHSGEWTKLAAEISCNEVADLPGTMWFAVKDENAGMLSDDVYDAFVLMSLYTGMYYGQDVHIHGNISKQLHRNVTNYLQPILCDFSGDLQRIDLKADGFAEAQGEQNIIGAGISCGVDSLTTIYDRFTCESDPDYRINGLFFFNCGTHGEYSDASRRFWLSRYELNKSAADELGLPVYQVDSNLHAFVRRFGNNARAGYFALWSCVMALGRAVRKYYVSSCFSYGQVMKFGDKFRNLDFAEFSESYSVPLIQTEKLEMILDGCQYERSGKVERISEWDIAKRHLNVCGRHSDSTEDAHNCSKCGKCVTTLIVLDALGRLDDFSGVFDIEEYRKHSLRKKYSVVFNHFKGIPEGNEADPYDYLRQHGMKMPSYFTAWLYLLPSRILSQLKITVRKIAGEKFYASVKRHIKGSQPSQS